MNSMRSRILTAGLLVLSAAAAAAFANDGAPVSERRVVWPVRIERGAFVDAAGRPAALRGFNYIRLFAGRSHNTFDPEHYDAAAVEQTLERWQTDGFNVVRVFLNCAVSLPGSMVRPGRPGLDPDYLRNVADFLGRAQRHGIGVMICTESFPRVAPYSNALRPAAPNVSRSNAEYIDAVHIEAKARFVKDVIVALRAAQANCLDAVFSYDLQNELCYQISPPFTIESGDVIGPSGKRYALPDQRQALADDAAIYFIDHLADAIHEAHPRALVSASVFTYAAVGRDGPGDFRWKQAGWQNRFPFRPLAMLRSKADFLDLHFYAANREAFDRDLASVEFDAVMQRAGELGKPLFVGEFGAFRQAFPEVGPAAAWMATLATGFADRGFSGWLYWTYDTHEQDNELWRASAGDGSIYRRLVALNGLQ